MVYSQALVFGHGLSVTSEEEKIASMWRKIMQHFRNQKEPGALKNAHSASSKYKRSVYFTFTFIIVLSRDTERVYHRHLQLGVAPESNGVNFIPPLAFSSSEPSVFSIVSNLLTNLANCTRSGYNS